MKKETLVLLAALLAGLFISGCRSLDAGDVIGLVRGNDSKDQQRAAGGCGGSSPLNTGAGSSLQGSSGGSARGETANVPWPSGEEWAAYGLRGLRQPAGSKVVNVALVSGVYYVSLSGAGRDAYNDLVGQVKSISGARNPYSQIRMENGEMIEFQFGEHQAALTVDYVSMELVIRLLK
jgi:hypothetical protein